MHVGHRSCGLVNGPLENGERIWVTWRRGAPRSQLRLFGGGYGASAVGRCFRTKSAVGLRNVLPLCVRRDGLV
jgi:hypothetical protein